MIRKTRPWIFRIRSPKGDWRGFSTRVSVEIDTRYYIPEIGISVPWLHCRCRRRSRQNALRKCLRALWPSHCQFDAWCFTASFSDLPPMSRIVYIGRSYSLSFSLPLSPSVRHCAHSPLVRALLSEAGGNVARGTGARNESNKPATSAPSSQYPERNSRGPRRELTFRATDRL